MFTRQKTASTNNQSTSYGTSHKRVSLSFGIDSKLMVIFVPSVIRALVVMYGGKLWQEKKFG